MPIESFEQPDRKGGRVAQFEPFRPQNMEQPTAQYANGVAIFYGPWDFTIAFYQGVPAPNPDDPNTAVITHSQLQRIVMSPQHTKAVMYGLRANLEKWEAQFGTIDVPQEVLTSMGITEGEKE
jgi:Protein of unknown function (DUF3467)